jgi:hypothetical protein
VSLEKIKKFKKHENLEIQQEKNAFPTCQLDQKERQALQWRDTKGRMTEGEP